MTDSYICSGAIMRCTMGDKTAKLTVLPTRTIYLCGQPMANISDHTPMVNLAPFGKCRSLGYPATASATAAHHGHLTPMPCIHNTPTNWVQGKTDFIIKGQYALLRSSKCHCIWGGTISFVNDGQFGEGTKYINKENKLSAEELIETSNISIGLSAESILEGIQITLDLAGLTPGVGAIPDLINAAIYAVRGDMLNAGLSLVAAVPVIGDTAGAAKILNKSIKLSKNINNVGSTTKTTIKTEKAITNSTTKLEKTATRETHLSPKEALTEKRLKQLGPNAEHGGSEMLYDTAPKSKAPKKLLEITKKNPNHQSSNGFEDLTYRDRFDIENRRVWEYIESESNTTSYNPFTLKEVPNPNETTSAIGNVTEALPASKNNIGIKPNVPQTPIVEKAKKILNAEEAIKSYTPKEKNTHILDIKI